MLDELHVVLRVVFLANTAVYNCLVAGVCIFWVCAVLVERRDILVECVDEEGTDMQQQASKFSAYARSLPHLCTIESFVTYSDLPTGCFPISFFPPKKVVEQKTV